MGDERTSARNAFSFQRVAVGVFWNDRLRERDDRADRQLPVMSPKLIVVAGAKERSP